MPATEKYLAQVVDNDDPNLMGGIKVSCPDFTGDEDQVLAGPGPEPENWIQPVLDWGWFYIPDVDEVIEIEAMVSSDDDEVPFQTAMFAPTFRWRGKRVWDSSETDAPRPIPDDFKTNYGKRRGFATPAGHIMFFDDTEGQEKIRLSLKLSEGGGNEYAYIDFDQSGNILLSNAGTGLLFLGKDAAEAGAAAWVVRGDEWKAWAETHTHPTGTGPSGAPIQPIQPSVLSDTTKVK